MPEPDRSPLEGSHGVPISGGFHFDPMLLQNLALRYAARDLNAGETEAFESQLANDQFARDALSEAVRLSAAALGQSPPKPHPSIRLAIRERLRGWCPGWLARRSYRGHPLAWAGLGAIALAACWVGGLILMEDGPKPSTPANANATSAQPGDASEIKFETVAPERHAISLEPAASADLQHEHSATVAPSCNEDHAGKPSVAEIWADLSTPDHVEKTHEEELRWRQKLREMGTMHPGRPLPTASINDAREP